ncbi:MAG: hypothetical protein Kow0042_01770 [Calditrichia bacterium]
MALDYVCHMEIDENNPDALNFEYQDKIYYFCTELCRVQFKADPEKYLKEAKTAWTKRKHKGTGNIK